MTLRTFRSAGKSSVMSQIANLAENRGTQLLSPWSNKIYIDIVTINHSKQIVECTNITSEHLGYYEKAVLVLGLISILGKLMRLCLDSGSNIIFTPWSQNNRVHGGN